MKKKVTRRVIAIGMFDGVHLGHKRVLKTAVDYAQKNNSETVVLTFDSIPKKQSGVLSTLTEKIRLLKSRGIKKVRILPFNKIKNLIPENFLKLYLKNCFCIVIGYDFRFGKERQGSVKTIKNFCKKVIIVKPVRYKSKIISSTLIKKELISGRIEHANSFLGQNYTFEGKVIEGLGLGKKLGFPTANLTVEKEKLLPEGIFVSKVKIGNKRYRSMTYIGRRPTLGLSAKTVEVYILGFKGRLYGKKISVELLSKIRSDKKFLSVKKLAQRIRKDLKITRRYFEK
ncbi:MAG TPA: bifunctional riboflavin kinase/FMN adenylyltransferase [Elusimicrobia bacterium]|nr:bifunctional riboflavin kinase/FMN adenylyltransferase [Elusimicrobiota bacterium]